MHLGENEIGVELGVFLRLDVRFESELFKSEKAYARLLIGFVSLASESYAMTLICSICHMEASHMHLFSFEYLLILARNFLLQCNPSL